MDPDRVRIRVQPAGSTLPSSFVQQYGRLSTLLSAYTGAFLSRYLHSTRRIRLFNRAMAAMLASCAVSCCGFRPCIGRAWLRGTS